MSERNRKLRDGLKANLEDAITDSTNAASAVNVGGKGKRTSVSSRQRVVHRDGVTTTTTEIREERTTDTEGR